MPTAVPPTPTPYYTGPLSPACGQLLPILPTHTTPQTTALTPDAAALTAVQNRIPDTAVAAWQYILNHPDNVGLVAYRVGNEANSVYLNADVQMPLASVVKLIPLVAYVEAVSNGELDPATPVPVDTLDAYYLSGYDLRSHNRALAELTDRGLISGDPPQAQLADVPWMMIRHSSNAAADYLHLLLGQERMEQTAVSLGLTSQTAPCTWLGQFMAMSNHTRSGSFLARKYLEWPMVFADNQELFSNLGYKNGSLPGILTTAYYAYPKGEVTPIVVILFFRDLPQPTYRQWRDTLPHDEFARWLLSDPAAIEAVKSVIGNR